MNSWINHLQPLIDEYKDGTEEPLDGDEVDRLCEIIKAKINLNEGNITTEEYENSLDNKPTDKDWEQIVIEDDRMFYLRIRDNCEQFDPIDFDVNKESIEEIGLLYDLIEQDYNLIDERITEIFDLFKSETMGKVKQFKVDEENGTIWVKKE